MNNDAMSSDPSTSEMRLVPTNLIDRDPDQIRRDWRGHDADQHLAELTDSVRQYGLLQPVVLRPHPEQHGRYLPIAGGRRLVASRRAGLEEVPALVRQAHGSEAYVLQLIENLQRQDLEPMDEARAYVHLLDTEGWSPPQLAERLHRSVQHVRERMKVFRDAVLREAVESGRITKTAAREIGKASDEVKDALRWRVQQGESISIERVEAIRMELAATGIENPRYSRPVTGATRQATGHAALQGRIQPGLPQGPQVKSVLEEAKATPPSGPQMAHPRPDPFDTVRHQGNEQRDVRFGNPEHIVVERPPSPYKRILPPVPGADTPSETQDAEGERGTIAPAEEDAETDGISAFNRAEAEPDDREQFHAYLRRLDGEAFKGALLYGVDRGWSCAALYSHVVALVR